MLDVPSLQTLTSRHMLAEISQQGRSSHGSHHIYLQEVVSLALMPIYCASSVLLTLIKARNVLTYLQIKYDLTESLLTLFQPRYATGCLPLKLTTWNDFHNFKVVNQIFTQNLLVTIVVQVNYLNFCALLPSKQLIHLNEHTSFSILNGVGRQSRTHSEKV
jgi:hypothetical protein